MIDLTGETPLTFKQASAVSPGHPHTQTLNRWCKDGIRGVRLESCLVGGRQFTTREALDRFITAVTNG